MAKPEPLPGTHLAQVDCMDCGRPVLAIPEAADTALCTACGRDKFGVTDVPVTRQRAAARTEKAARPKRTAPADMGLPWTAICPRCSWRHKMGSPEHVALAVKNHYRIKHDPKGWASGVQGGVTGRVRRRSY